MNEGVDSKVCRICFENETSEKPVISPCKCRGSSKYIHEDCLSTWLLTQEDQTLEKKCELCKYKYNLKITTVKKFDPRGSISQNPHFLCYFCILLLVTALLIILIYVIIERGYIDPKNNIFYFLGLILVFFLALLCSSCIMIRLVKGLLFTESSRKFKIIPMKNENIDLNTTSIVNSLYRVDSGDAVHDEELRKINHLH